VGCATTPFHSVVPAAHLAAAALDVGAAAGVGRRRRRGCRRREPARPSRRRLPFAPTFPTGLARAAAAGRRSSSSSRARSGDGRRRVRRRRRRRVVELWVRQLVHLVGPRRRPEVNAPGRLARWRRRRRRRHAGGLWPTGDRRQGGQREGEGCGGGGGGGLVRLKRACGRVGCRRRQRSRLLRCRRRVGRRQRRWPCRCWRGLLASGRGGLGGTNRLGRHGSRRRRPRRGDSRASRGWRRCRSGLLDGRGGRSVDARRRAPAASSHSRPRCGDRTGRQRGPMRRSSSSSDRGEAYVGGFPDGRRRMDARGRALARTPVRLGWRCGSGGGGGGSARRGWGGWRARRRRAGSDRYGRLRRRRRRRRLGLGLVVVDVKRLEQVGQAPEASVAGAGRQGVVPELAGDPRAPVASDVLLGRVARPDLDLLPQAGQSRREGRERRGGPVGQPAVTAVRRTGGREGERGRADEPSGRFVAGTTLPSMIPDGLGADGWGMDIDGQIGRVGGSGSRRRRRRR